MRINEKNTLDIILKHKTYFDEKLIDFVSTAEEKIEELTIRIEELKEENKTLKRKFRVLELKNEDSEKRYNEMSRLLSNKNKEIEDIRKKIEQYQEDMKKDKKEREELKKILEDTQKRNDEITKSLNKKIKKLQSSNSTNSNLGSYFDILAHTKAKANANERKKSGLKRGGQQGHKLHKSAISETPDEIVVKYVKKAPGGAIKKEDKNGAEYFVTQEIDLVFKSHIKEIRYYVKDDGEDLEDTLKQKYSVNPVIYTPHFKASVVYLNQFGTIPLQRLCDIIYEISYGNIKVKPSTIVNWNYELNKNSRELREMILAEILANNIVHVDETGNKVNASQTWFHTLTNDKGSYFMSTHKRGDKENGPFSVLQLFEGTLVHDHFRLYSNLKKCKHAECNAHIQRYLQSGIDIDKSKECQEMLDLFHEMLREKTIYLCENKTEMESEKIEGYKKRYRSIAKKGLEEYYNHQKEYEKVYKPDYVCTFQRLLEFEEDHFRFLTDFSVPYTNNKAEKMCRKIKAKKKVSGHFVSSKGAEAYAASLTLIETSKIKKENALDVLEQQFY